MLWSKMLGAPWTLVIVGKPIYWRELRIHAVWMVHPWPYYQGPYCWAWLHVLRSLVSHHLVYSSSMSRRGTTNFWCCCFGHVLKPEVILYVGILTSLLLFSAQAYRLDAMQRVCLQSSRRHQLAWTRIGRQAPSQLSVASDSSHWYLSCSSEFSREEPWNRTVQLVVHPRKWRWNCSWFRFKLTYSTTLCCCWHVTPDSLWNEEFWVLDLRISDVGVFLDNRLIHIHLRSDKLIRCSICPIITYLLDEETNSLLVLLGHQFIPL